MATVAVPPTRAAATAATAAATAALLAGARGITSSAHAAAADKGSKKASSKEVAEASEQFDDITYNIPEKPVSAVEGVGYSLVGMAGEP